MRDFAEVVRTSKLILTEGAVGTRIVQEYGMKPDPHIGFAPLIYDEKGKRALSEIYREYTEIAARENLPMILLTNTRRANAERMGASDFDGRHIMADYARFLRGIARECASPVYIGGMMGAKGDAYTGGGALSYDEAMAFHRWQTDAFRDSDIDFLFYAIMPSVEETRACIALAAEARKPCIVSFMMRRDGALPDGTSIHDAIAALDAPGRERPVCYMTNCVHPDIAKDAIQMATNATAEVRARFIGIQANAANLSPEELDGRGELAADSPETLADAFERMHRAVPLRIAGGCCGTIGGHLSAIARRMKALTGA